MADNLNLNLALMLAGRGWKVFPCGMDKQPRTIHGYLDATTDPAIFKKWFSQDTGLIGIACSMSGAFVVDIDNTNEWENFCNGRPYPIGPAQKTPRGGTHLFYKLPEKIHIPNNAGILARGVDLRSAGYVCTGRGYSWLFEHGPLCKMPNAPKWLLDEICAMQAPPPAPTGQREETQQRADVDYLLKKYLSYAQPGGRDHACYHFGLQLFYADVSRAEAETLAVKFARACPQPPGAPYTEKEAIRAIKSAYKAKSKRPAWVLNSRTA